MRKPTQTGLVRTQQGLSGTGTGLIIGTGLSKVTGFLPTLFNAGFFVAVAGAAYLLLKKFLVGVKKNAVIADMGQSTIHGLAAAYATQFFNAMIRSAGWISDWFGDGTNTDVIYATASEMHRHKVSFADVNKAYKGLYQRDLLEHLQSELDSEEMIKFNTLLTTGLGGIPVIDHVIISAKPTMVLNGELKTIQSVSAGVKLGAHLETMILPNGTHYQGFQYNGQIRYVDSLATRLSPIRS
ncbi:hypothetical protein [Adhaeribacter pallidiroseus]|uniref:Uncharacterized protein n=1 Tax=Adhaeribacter pallidiroseus TaxID=2072847 RepID=A0A369QQE0_9BACT|nr:hypothetical protein [Adhaeribacter pallidiroseus]RDC65069.1 hypothetical protein AHMF7616_03692 [Adhaeribacter pallidiroseus]